MGQSVRCIADNYDYYCLIIINAQDTYSVALHAINRLWHLHVRLVLECSLLCASVIENRIPFLSQSVSIHRFHLFICRYRSHINWINNYVVEKTTVLVSAFSFFGVISLVRSTVRPTALSLPFSLANLVFILHHRNGEYVFFLCTFVHRFSACNNNSSKIKA